MGKHTGGLQEGPDPTPPPNLTTFYIEADPLPTSFTRPAAPIMESVRGGATEGIRNTVTPLVSLGCVLVGPQSNRAEVNRTRANPFLR